VVVRYLQETVLTEYQRACAHNIAVFRGRGSLGADFFRAAALSKPAAGYRCVEGLIDVTSGKIVEILQPDPLREYEQEYQLANGETRTVQLVLSTVHPQARLALFLVAASDGFEVIDVIARDEILPEARACLRESIDEIHGVGCESRHAA
jgi:hypothetical protein